MCTGYGSLSSVHTSSLRGDATARKRLGNRMAYCCGIKAEWSSLSGGERQATAEILNIREPSNLSKRKYAFMIPAVRLESHRFDMDLQCL